MTDRFQCTRTINRGIYASPVVKGNGFLSKYRYPLPAPARGVQVKKVITNALIEFHVVKYTAGQYLNPTAKNMELL